MRVGGVPGCTTRQLSVSLHGVEGGLSHAGYAIRFRNISRTACVMAGYPGVDGATGSGHAVVHAKRTPYGYLGGGRQTRVVTLAPGATASALYEGVNGRTEGGPPCPSYSILVVTPPANTKSVRFQGQPTLCYPEIHPIVRGSNGRANTP